MTPGETLSETRFFYAGAKQKLFRGRSKAFKIYTLFKMMIFFASNHHCYICFLYFDCLCKYVQKTKPLHKYLEPAQELRKLAKVAKKN